MRGPAEEPCVPPSALVGLVAGPEVVPNEATLGG